MISRYSVDEIDEIWSDKNKYDTWLNVENLIVEAWAKLNVVPKKDLLKIKTKTIVNLNRMLEIEQATKHDVVAFTRMLSEQLGEEKKWIHLGITSTDIVDTAQNYLIKQSNQLVKKELDNLLETLKKLASKNKDQLIMGRTHGMYGEPTSLGLKFALWYDEIKRQIERLTLASNQIEVAKVSGSMGNYANLELEVEEYVASKLGLNIDNISTQVTQRDRHAFLIMVFGNIASTIEKIATEIRLLSRSEIQEINEGFAKGQKGSSSMPHKKNPISSENITGLARYIKTFYAMSLDNNNLWHERDISHSSNERIIFPDIYNVLVYVLRRTNSTLNDLSIDYEKIDLHISQANRIYFSQRVLTYILINTNAFSREEIYDFIQSTSNQAAVEKKDFLLVLKQNNVDRFIKFEQIEKLFDNNFFLRQTDKIFSRVFNLN